jgi:hypothetical protein
MLIIFFSAHLSYNYNFFRVVPDEWFVNHQIDSEQLVLDGILHSIKSASDPVLGRYARPEIVNSTFLARDLYERGDTSGYFNQYKSQYGLQVKVLSLLCRLGIGDVYALHAIMSSLMSIVVVLMFALVSKRFSILLAVGFASVYIFSPWVVVFSRNLYWVSFTWFLPMLATMAISARVSNGFRQEILLFALLFAAFFIKLLCGYEYLTTIFISSCVPIFFHAINYSFPYKKTLRLLFLNIFALLFAFSSSIIIHSYALSNIGESGMSFISITAKKRLHDDSPRETAKAACFGDSDCEHEMITSLQSNSIQVAAKYLFAPNIVPWSAHYKPTQEIRESIKILKENMSLGALYDFYNKSGIQGIISAGAYLVFHLFHNYALILLICLTIVASWRLVSEIKLAIIVAFIAPLSWFLIAKGHSYVHVNMNFVLWYIPFIPICILAIGVSFHKGSSQMTSRWANDRGLAFGRAQEATRRLTLG